ncbi:WD40 repeat domain-containing protein [Thalassobacillus sp. CUG 92003]|uniref:WD40 repeat domain-containing protein n=1 Tax=Thalassobacillus sp. CUG 92003 TaxID=2736641 RepID=UPI0015E6C6BB|nr:hypothetical protein [Thalassobacillus sp. CUG 92003]
MNVTEMQGHSSHVNKVRFSKDSNYIASAGFSGELYLWDVETREKVQVYEGHTQTVNGVEFLNDETLVAASGDGTITAHSISTSAPELEWQDPKSGVNHLAVSHKKEHIITSTKTNLFIVREWPDGHIITKKKSDHKQSGVMDTAQTHLHMMIGGLGKQLRRFDIQSGEEIERMKAHETATMGFRFFDDDRHGISVGYDGAIMIWDMTAHQLLESHQVGDTGFYGIAVSPQGDRAAVCLPHALKIIRLKDLATEAVDVSPKGNYDVTFSPDGQRIAMASADKRIRLFES